MRQIKICYNAKAAIYNKINQLLISMYQINQKPLLHEIEMTAMGEEIDRNNNDKTVLLTALRPRRAREQKISMNREDLTNINDKLDFINMY